MREFILNPSVEDDHGLASIKAIRSYSIAISSSNPKLAEELWNWVGSIRKEENDSDARQQGE